MIKILAGFIVGAILVWLIVFFIKEHQEYNEFAQKCYKSGGFVSKGESYLTSTRYYCVDPNAPVILKPAE